MPSVISSPAHSPAGLSFGGLNFPQTIFIIWYLKLYQICSDLYYSKALSEPFSLFYMEVQKMILSDILHFLHLPTFNRIHHKHMDKDSGWDYSTLFINLP
jgi:hypothetical protein